MLFKMRSGWMISVFVIHLLCNTEVFSEPEGNPDAEFMSTNERDLLAKYLLQKLLGKEPHRVERRQPELRRDSSVVYPEYQDYEDKSDYNVSGDEDHPGEPSQVVPTFVVAPASVKKEKSEVEEIQEDKTDSSSHRSTRFSMPLVTLAKKKYYIGVFFKANWYKAAQFCRFHGLHMASIEDDDVQNDLEDHIKSLGLGEEHFWTSGSDQGEEGKFYWMSTGKPVTYQHWNAGEPNNFEYENGEQEHCLELWNRDGKGLGWNDTPCSFETFFICQL